jgi:CheY-like chemotaxis protein
LFIKILESRKLKAIQAFRCTPMFVFFGPGPVMIPFLFSSPDSNNRSNPSQFAGDGVGAQSPALRILVVDDERVIADTIVQILNRSGFIAEAAYDGRAAIERATRHCPDLVLSDVLMPEVDGVEAAIAIRQICPETRIVLFSGQAATVEILARARQRGHEFELLPKPIHPVELIKRLREV